MQTAANVAKSSREIDVALEGVKPREAAVERRDKKEGEEHLDAGDHNAHLAIEL